MTDRRLFVGETVLVSRDESGENHEEAIVVDYYELLIEGDRRPMVVVDFMDGERVYITAREPNVVVPEPEPEEDDTEASEASGEEAHADAEPAAAGNEPEPDGVEEA